MKEGWWKKKLNQIASINTGKWDANHENKSGVYNFFTCAAYATKCDTKTFNGECIILPGNGVNVGRLYYFSGEFDTYQRTYVINNIQINPKFLFYHMLNDWASLAVKKQYGSATNFIKKQNFDDYDVFFPLGEEQSHIVDILDKSFAEIDKAKTNAEKNLKNAKELFESYLNNILEKNKHFCKSLGDVCERVEYGSAKKSNNKGIVPVLRMGNIQNGKFDWTNLVYSDNEEDNEKYSLKYNDVLFNRTNSPELVGKTAIFKGEMKAIFAGYLIRIHRKDNLLDADYLNYYLNSAMAINYGKTVAISSVNQANINGTKLKSYPIPLPPLIEQQSIVQKLDELSSETKKLEDIYKKQIENLEELKKSILEKAFKGEI